MVFNANGLLVMELLLAGLIPTGTQHLFQLLPQWPHQVQFQAPIPLKLQLAH